MKLSHIFAAMALIGATAASAQDLTADDILLLSSNKADMSYAGADVNVLVKSKKNFTLTSDSEWLTAEIDPANAKVVRLKGRRNTSNEPRTGTVTLSNDVCTRTIVVEQEYDQSIESAPTDTRLLERTSSWSSTPSNNYGSNTLAKAFDNDLNTFWHSGTINTAYTVTAAIRDGQGQADYFMYNTRRDGNTNGNWQQFELQVKCEGETEFRSLGTYNAAGGDKIVDFPEALDIKEYRVVIQPGTAGWISASEIGVYRKAKAADTGADVFEDEMLLALKPGVTQEQIDAIPNEFYRVHAQRLYDGNYDTKYRYAKYECYLSNTKLNEQWNLEGKQYDQIPGVTGINFITGKNAVIVRGIPDGQNVQLKVVAWWNGWEGGNFDGCNPITTTFTLHNGLNTIDYHCQNSYGDWAGLAYIAYFADDVDYHQTIEEQKAAHPDIEVHFVNGQQNGYLCKQMTNEEMHEITANAKNVCIDLVGEKVHQIWTAKGLHDYCRATDGSLGYLQYMNYIDLLIYWEHKSLGIYKYDRVPRNRTMAYVNYTYYMFQGGFGVSFHHDQESRVFNMNSVLNRDQDLTWGLSHEWGHQHQMHPYFCWAGMGEVTNNIQSYFNIMKMGYGSTNPRPSNNEFNTAYQNFVVSDSFIPDSTRNDDSHAAVVGKHKYSYGRWRIYQNYRNESLLKFSQDYLSFIGTLSDSTCYTKAQNPLKATNILETDVTMILIPKVNLMKYFFMNPSGPKGQSPESPYLDFTADWYEALRQNDQSTGSQIEKTSTSRDKYELLAAAQNSNRNGALAELKSKYPTSTWVTHDYLTAAGTPNRNTNVLPFIMNWCRKCSRLTGYNLYRYFWEWGYFRTIAMYVGDYGSGFYVCTPEMLEEFKADMQALVDAGEIDDLDDETFSAMCTAPHWILSKPNIPNTGEIDFSQF